MSTQTPWLFESAFRSSTSAIGLAEASPGAAASCLGKLPTPTAFTKPARDLTRREARDIVVHLLGQGAFRLKDPPRFGAACQILQPQPQSRLVIQPAVIDGVRFVGSNRKANFIDNLDVRMLVGLFRLANMLRRTWGATEIHHMGIGHGNGAPTDCHNTGRAIDLAGVAGTITGSSTPSLNGPYVVNVRRDWGNRPVVMPDGTSRPNWPPKVRTKYRLGPSPNFLAFAIFRDIYTLATR